MGIKVSTNAAGERCVEQSIDLPLSSLKYLKWLPGLIGALGLMVLLLMVIAFDIHKIKSVPIPASMCYFALTPEETLKQHQKLIDYRVQELTKKKGK